MSINNDFDMGRTDRGGMRHGTHIAEITILSGKYPSNASARNAMSGKL
ncbi:hypothetical protein NYG90_05380 [Helicobacter sp. XJK30-2]|uniref:Uncharacterized protein n=1 Tax=Helicobacter zhangjianzhongii TaxID=2974574 RepID=A0ACC6FSA1_9HELI|nr:hypothetical protein [Helicobacter sp. XJK30-2]MDL0082106.1 hypothetical protein [Helicobacter sp. XJK30-2]